MVRFILNNQSVCATQPKGSTVLDYVRYHKRLTGTKIGCREGDCGACTILVGGFEGNKLVYRSMTSCLMPLGNAQGKHIVTVEGINGKELTPVQQAMVDANGTQCGFCTLGFVMSFTGFALDEKHRSYEAAIAAIDGNICRCTGYKSIERSAKVIAERLTGKPASDSMSWLVAQGFVPSYFLQIETRLKELKQEETPESITTDNQLPLSGGTDLLVQRPGLVKRSPVKLLFGSTHLKGIQLEGTECVIGGGVTVTEFWESDLIRSTFPDLSSHIKLVSSTPIRNMATLAGNLVNASPIGDMTVFFLALNARVVLEGADGQRAINLKDFYRGYKLLDKQPGELITQIRFDQPNGALFNFEKVSKRTNLDIASVNSACQMVVEGDVIKEIHLSAGGVAPFPKYLTATAALLKGKRLDATVLEKALQTANEEVAPISDARGSSDYKRLLLRQLLLAHFLKLIGPTAPLKNYLLA